MADNRYFKIVKLPRAFVVELVLPEDIDTAAFTEINGALIEQWPIDTGANVVIDLALTQYLGSMLLGLLVNIRHEAKTRSGQVVLCNVPTPVSKVIRSTNLERLIVISGSRAEALGRF
ncbi:MAG TPA: STAS domain-containing protein [Tepidisphaeraceae bacterium]|nr:STAS domain-containing protein [Tepidisphaeraceae bacterium]